MVQWLLSLNSKSLAPHCHEFESHIVRKLSSYLQTGSSVVRLRCTLVSFAVRTAIVADQDLTVGANTDPTLQYNVMYNNVM